MRIVLACIIFAWLLPATALAADAANDDSAARAKALIDRMEDLYRGKSSRATVSMSIETPQYQRTMTMQAESIGTKESFIRILSPRKDRGIATLKLDMQMWNYFPKINKVIKIPPSMMMGSWMGSDFTNDDLVKQTTLTKEYNLHMEESADQYRITLTPRESTVTVWGKIDYVISKQPLLPVSESFYDDSGVLIRKLAFKEPKEFSGKLLPSVLEMVPLNKAGHRTVITYESMTFNPPDVTQDDFTLRNLTSRF